MLHQFLSVSLVTAMAAAPPAASQGIPRGASISGASVISSGPPALAVLVATPYTLVPGDSGSAVLIGNGMRDKLTKSLSTSDWRVVTRTFTNQNLTTYGYSPDQILGVEAVRQLAVTFTVRVYVSTVLTKGDDGRFIATVRVAGPNDPAGFVLKGTQVPNQSAYDFGQKLADQANIVFKAFPDARECNDNQTSAKPKAIASAGKAVKTLPNYGFAEFCLGAIDEAGDPMSASAVTHYRNALIGDPMSLQAIQHIAGIDIGKKDSAAVVTDFQQMIVIAPTNRAIADNAVKVFSAYGHPEAAAQVVDQQIKIDPTNPDWFELKGNSCAREAITESDPVKAKPRFECAFGAYAHEYEIDPQHASSDTTFFSRILYVAPTAKDSATWAHIWAQKYPNASDPLKAETQLYLDANQLDSAKTVARLLVALDTTEYKGLVLVAGGYVKAGRDSEAVAFLPVFKKMSEDARNAYAGVLITTIQTLAQAPPPRADSQLVQLSQAVIDVNPTAPNYLIYANYFMSIGLVDQLTPVSTTLRSAKTCDAAKTEQALLTRLDAALAVAATSSNAGIADFGKTTPDKIASEKQFVSDMMVKELKCP